MKLIKSHALGNDFLLIDAADTGSARDVPELARAVCERHRGIGADGLLIFSRTANPVTMRLLNADGSASEISGNGLRCLAAWLAHTGATGEIVVDTDAGRKRLQLLDQSAHRYTFAAAMGQPEQITLERIPVNGVDVEAVTLRVGNPQCVASALAVHPRFSEGTNVELATVETPDRVRILIWERGVGPTEASGTGACAAAVAAIAYGGASREVDIQSPGGTQRVAWRDDGLHLTGWAEIVAEVDWLGG
jgi:diaminopimelate epimerase